MFEESQQRPAEVFQRDHLLDEFTPQWRETFEHLEVRPIGVPDELVKEVIADMLVDELAKPFVRRPGNDIYQRQDIRRRVQITLVYKN